MRGIWIVAALWIGGCGQDLDPAPFGRSCQPTGAACPAPYECVSTFPPSGPAYYACFVPCHGDGDCGDGFLCNTMQTEQVGNVPSNHCYRPGGG